MAMEKPKRIDGRAIAHSPARAASVVKSLARCCPICGGGQGEVLHTQRFALMDDDPLPPEYNVVNCAACGMIFADTPATQADYDAFYRKFSIYESPAESSGAETPPWDRARLKGVADILARCAPSRDARILDVGCANGGLLEALRALGFSNLTGIDPSAACVAHTRANGIEAHRGEVTKLPAGLGRFDVVILTAVLEHLVEVKAAISSLVDVCADHGRIYLEVPDAARYAQFLHAPFQDFNTEHINHFSLASLRNLMQPAGFSLFLDERLTVSGASGLGFPCLEAAFEGGEERRAADGWIEDPNLRESIQRYIVASGAMMKALDHQLRKTLASSPEVIVWGTGQLAMKLLCDTALKDARVMAFVDGNAINQGRRLRGVRIVRPEEIGAEDVPIIISTLLHTDGIRSKIRSLGLKNPVVTLTV